MDIDGAIRAGDYILAAERLTGLMRTCLGYAVGSNVAELAKTRCNEAATLRKF
jgi:hypothetical protein